MGYIRQQNESGHKLCGNHSESGPDFLDIDHSWHMTGLRHFQVPVPVPVVLVKGFIGCKADTDEKNAADQNEKA